MKEEIKNALPEVLKKHICKLKKASMDTRKKFKKILDAPHFFERGLRIYIVSDEKAVSFVGSGDELLQNLKTNWQICYGQFAEDIVY